jgi:hypothetical protein
VLTAPAGTPVLSAEPVDINGVRRYQVAAIEPDSPADLALRAFWHIFSAIRVFRQLGTAQVISVYTTLFGGWLLDPAADWRSALDSALADSLADQLQVLTRPEQRILALYLDQAGNAEAFGKGMEQLLRRMPEGRRAALHRELRAAAVYRSLAQADNSPDDAAEPAKALPSTVLLELFAADQPLALPAAGIFHARLEALMGERGL